MIMSVYSHNCYGSVESEEEILKFFVQQRGLRRPFPLYSKPYVTFTELLYGMYKIIFPTNAIFIKT
jgi:hypothetical protein